MVKGYSKSEEVDQLVAGIGSSDLNLSKHTKIKNEDSDHFDSDFTAEDNKVHTNEDHESGGNDDNGIKKRKCSYREISKERINSSMVHNTRGQAEIFKNANNKNE